VVSSTRSFLADSITICTSAAHENRSR
jgi:hypothetical protein